VEKYKITLTEEERRDLENVVGKGKAATRRLTHARILLLADEGDGRNGRSDEEIAETLHAGPRTIARVRKRFVTEGFAQAIEHRPQPSRPDKIKLSKEAEQQLVKLACTDPPDGRGTWTVELLANRLVRLRHVDTVSRETVRKALKKTTFDSES
jgi:transposase